MTPEQVVQAQFDAYNAQDLDRFCACYAEDAVIAELAGPVLQEGRAEIRARFERSWAQFPRNRARVLSRIVVGDTVVDHEVGEREPGGRSFELVAVYTVRGGRIVRLDMRQRREP
jgi:hypothetical protein